MLRTIALFIVSFSTVFASNLVMAGPLAATAKVVILPALDVRQETAIDFGQIRNGTGACTMGPNGTLSGSAGLECTGNETPGTFIVSGSSNSVIDMSVTGGAADGVVFSPLINGSTQRTLINGSARVTVLGSIKLDQASPGVRIISYTFTANYN